MPTQELKLEMKVGATQMQVTFVTGHPEAPMELRAQVCCRVGLGKNTNIVFGEGGELQKGELTAQAGRPVSP